MTITNTGMEPLRLRLSKAEMERLRIDEGLSWEQIGRMYFVTGNACYKLGRQYGARGITRKQRIAIYHKRLAEIDDGSEPAWLVAERVGCKEYHVRRWRKARGIKNSATHVDPAKRRIKCPRCTFPPSRENPMIGTFCLLCWCDLLHIDYRRTFVESGWAARLGLIPERKKRRWSHEAERSETE